MKIFISYRRSDTGGRSGRLFDAIVARFGVRNVFHDVTTIEPGADFERRVDEAISSSDVVLVVLGAEWLSVSGPDGARRLDDADDYVRREVGSALRSGVRVVPVLVDGAALPAATDLPADLAALASRQSVALGDDTWHQDVSSLIRRLEGDELVEAPARPRRRIGVAAVGVLAIAAAGWVWWAGRDSDSAGSSEEPPPCRTPDAAWTHVIAADDARATVQDEGSTLTYTVTGADFRVEAPGEWTVMVQVELANETGVAAAGTTVGVETPYYSYALFDDIVVDGIVREKVACFSVDSDDKNIEPDERAVGTVGYRSYNDPTGKSLVLELDGGTDIRVTESA